MQIQNQVKDTRQSILKSKRKSIYDNLTFDNVYKTLSDMNIRDARALCATLDKSWLKDNEKQTIREVLYSLAFPYYYRILTIGTTNESDHNSRESIERSRDVHMSYLKEYVILLQFKSNTLLSILLSGE